jgi:uncharacterized membrane protein
MRNKNAGATAEMRLAQGLGWFSVGLGLLELLAPARIARLAGVPRSTGVIRLLGLRELANGIGILAQRRPTQTLWARVAGDVMDLGLLGSAVGSPQAQPPRIAAAAAAVAGIAALDLYCANRVRRNPAARFPGVHLERSITINRPPDELYAFWRRFETLPQFMNHLEAVEVKDERHSHWVAKGPAGLKAEWDAEIIQDKPGELISWRSVEGSSVDNAGSVRFERATGGRGTVLRVKLAYTPPAGSLGTRFARIFGEAPEKQVPVDLMRFKQLMETGEILRTEGQPAGRSKSSSRRFDDFVRA